MLLGGEHSMWNSVLYGFTSILNIAGSLLHYPKRSRCLLSRALKECNRQQTVSELAILSTDTSQHSQNRVGGATALLS